MTRRAALFALAGAGSGGVAAASFLQLDIESQRMTASLWPAPDVPVPFGSLMKPFVALAYGAAHGYVFPEITCRGCWKPDGHGRLSLVSAVACSCNTYFLELARGCSVDGIARTAAAYGLETPRSDRPESWIGLGPGWSVAPLSLVRAFAELGTRRTEQGPSLVLRGMRLSAQGGTARGIRANAFAKTGTGPCTHVRRGTGDGFAVALYPADGPRSALLVGVHDKPGAEAARAAGLLIHPQPPGATHSGPALAPSFATLHH